MITNPEVTAHLLRKDGSMTERREIKVGDIVRLATNLEPLTATAKTQDGRWTCSYVENCKLRSVLIPEGLLRHVDPTNS